MGHCGYVAEGVVYLLVGGLALAAAVDPSQRPNGSAGALSKLATAPFGELLLALLAFGLAAFVLWQVLRGILDPEHRRGGRTARRLAVRFGYILNGALHTVLVGEAAWRLFGFSGPAGQGHALAVWISRAMALPFGRWLIALTGAGIMLFGIFQFYRGASRSKLARVDLSHTRLRGIIIALGVAGFPARGVLFGLIGAFLIGAARRHDANDATGIAGALDALKQHPFGPWLLGIIAVGLMCYGLFQIIKEPYRNFAAS